VAARHACGADEQPKKLKLSENYDTGSIGTKPLLKELIEEVRNTNALLRREGIPIADAKVRENAAGEWRADN
jgi:hypothetical protein